MKLSIVIICLIAISCVITLFGVLGHVNGSGTQKPRYVLISQPSDADSDVETPLQQPIKPNPIQKSKDQTSNNPDDFYRVIIENNIFRPINWKPTQQEPAFRLLGTSTTRDGITGTAYITDRKTNQFYAAKVGEKIGTATVTEIQQKQVTLDKNGKTMQLYMASSPFLSRTRSRGDTAYRPPQQQSRPKDSTAQRTQPLTAKDTERTAWREAQKKRITELKEMAEKLRTVSEQERRKMQEHFE